MSDFHYSKEVPLKTIEGTISFTTLPIRIHRDDSRAKKASRRFRAAWAAASTDSTQSIRSSETPMGHLFSLAIPECSPHMLEFMAKLWDYGCLENDLMDMTELQPGVSTQNNPETGQSPFQLTSEWLASFNPKHKRLATELMVDLLAIDHPRIPRTYDYIREYWKHRRCIKKPTSWEEFLDYRIAHAGCLTGPDAICVAMDIDLDDDAIDSVRNITDPLMAALALVNDYFSYAKEKDLPDDNSVNGVKFLMQQEGMSEETALNSVRAKVIEFEQAHNTAFDEWLKGEQQSPELRRYLVAWRLAGGGGHFAHTISARYGHYDAGGRHYSQHWTFWLLAVSACGFLLALLLKLYGTEVEIITRLVGYQSLLIGDY